MGRPFEGVKRPLFSGSPNVSGSVSANVSVSGSASVSVGALKSSVPSNQE